MEPERITPQAEGAAEADYVIGDKLGEGGMAVTYVARQRKGSITQLYALKVLKSDAGDEALFHREAQFVAGLRHSNIVGLKDIDLPRRRLLFELIDGVDLRELINSVDEQRLPPHLVVYIATELCKALAYAHHHERPDGSIGIVHRDISAGNVMISLHGEVKLADFGVAATIRRPSEPHSATVRGKVCYMAPEQALGLPLDGRADLFSLGVLCFELLASQRPYDADNDAQTIVRAARGQREALTTLAPETPLRLIAIIDRLLQADRNKRYGDADELFDALSLIAPPPNVCRELGYLVMRARGLVAEGANSGVIPKPVIRPSEQSRSSVRRPKTARWVRGGVAAALALTGGGWWLTRGDDEVVAPAQLPQVAVPAEPPEPAPVLTITSPAQADESAPLPSSTTTAQEIDTPPPAEQPEQPAASDQSVLLQVGSRPLAPIWLDGRMVGWAPVKNLRVSPGEHAIGAGEGAPQVTRKIVVHAGEPPAPILLRLKK